MAIKLTTPKTSKAITEEAITRINLEIPHLHDGTDFKIDTSNVRIRIYIDSCSNDGSTDFRRRDAQAGFAAMPQSVRLALKDAYEEVETWAQSQDVLGAGTAETIQE